jgi:Asp-tRNA(Asn)/Glu-tRNA(Gln) amidotransferase A subunit family amidase
MHTARYRLLLTVAFIALVGVLVYSKTGTGAITTEAVAMAERLIGLEFTVSERDSMIEGLTEHRENFEALRKITLANSVPPAILFDPIPVGMRLPSERKPFVMSTPPAMPATVTDEEMAFYSVRQLSELIRTRKVTSEYLTKMYLSRLKKYGPKLECVITLMDQQALEQARRADREIAAGKYRGPLHGIPYGAKDLLATRGTHTTWGAAPYKDQVIDRDATVIRRLEDAGAVLVAKLTMGALAWGDVWYGGKTRNPWNYDQGSSGSSAGSASATAAGLVGFAIGTETWGSIVSPSTRCGTSGLRPTYGRVSRTGAMALSWSMDKIGPICRTVEDCALVFNAIYGPDGEDQTLYDVPFNYNPDIHLSGLRIGYVKAEFDTLTENKKNNAAMLETMRKLGATLIPFELPDFPVEDLSFILSAEAAAAFDDLTRSGKDDLLVRQIKNAWPNVFRQARFVPAVEYLQANRIRYLVIQDMATRMKNIDVYITPPFGESLLLTNLTGHPCVVVPNGFSEEGTPTSVTFIGNLFDEATLLAVAQRYQEATDFHLRHPTLKE